MAALLAVFVARRDVLAQIKNERSQYHFDAIVHKPVSLCIDRLEEIQQQVSRWRRNPSAEGRDNIHDEVLALARKLDRVCNDIATFQGQAGDPWLSVETDELLEAVDSLDHTKPIVTSHALEGAARRLTEAVTQLLRGATTP